MLRYLTVCRATFMISAASSFTALAESATEHKRPTCSQFKFGIVAATSAIDNGLTLPNYVQASKDFPNDIEIANYNFAKTVFSCSDNGNFDGIGMTLVSSDMQKEWDTAIFVVLTSALKTIRNADAKSVIANLRNGDSYAEQAVGPYLISYKTDGKYPRFGIDVGATDK